jgi:ADP-ribose pyrophosphatase
MVGNMDYELIEKQVIYEGNRIRLEVHHLLSGGQRHRKEIVVHPGAVVIVPVLDAQTIVLIRNRRYAVGGYLVELPAGTLEKGEDPINCAGRELLEETGYLAHRLKPMASYYASPGVMTEKMHVFIAYDLEKRQQELDAGEDIQLLPVTIGEAVEMIRTGEIQDAKTIAALMMYDRFFRSEGP